MSPQNKLTGACAWKEGELGVCACEQLTKLPCPGWVLQGSLYRRVLRQEAAASWG